MGLSLLAALAGCIGESFLPASKQNLANLG
jgi:hypothetical protein